MVLNIDVISTGILVIDAVFILISGYGWTNKQDKSFLYWAFASLLFLFLVSMIMQLLSWDLSTSHLENYRIISNSVEVSFSCARVILDPLFVKCHVLRAQLCMGTQFSRWKHFFSFFFLIMEKLSPLFCSFPHGKVVTPNHGKFSPWKSIPLFLAFYAEAWLRKCALNVMILNLWKSSMCQSNLNELIGHFWNAMITDNSHGHVFYCFCTVQKQLYIIKGWSTTLVNFF